MGGGSARSTLLAAGSIVSSGDPVVGELLESAAEAAATAHALGGELLAQLAVADPTSFPTVVTAAKS